MRICLLLSSSSSSISRRPSFSDHSQHILVTLILVFLFSSSTWFHQKYFIHSPIISHSFQMISPFLSSYFHCCYYIYFSTHIRQFIINSDSPAMFIFIGPFFLYFPLPCFKGLFRFLSLPMFHNSIAL